MSTRQYDAVIFDLDGTLIDSEPVYRRVDHEFVTSRGISIPDSEWDHYVGMAGPRFIEVLRERHGLEGETEDLLAETRNAYLEAARGNTRVFPALRELVLGLLLRGLKLAVVTSSKRVTLDAMFRETGLGAVFPVSISVDDVKLPKPAPEPFLAAAAKLGVDPARCCVVEDSQYGVEAARGAGMGVIALPAPGHESLPAYARADLAVTGGAEAADHRLLLRSLGLDPEGHPEISAFRETVHAYYRSHRRPMPWRETHNPYHVLVSEVMLQQTQVDRVIPKYLAFLESFPTVDSLADASLGDVLALWQGLGYNRRAKNLHETAKCIVERFSGVVPRDVVSLQTLPGVGPYTAGAVRAFAYDRPAVFLETNIRRVFLHVFFPRAEEVTDRQLLPLLGATLDHHHPRLWYQALMDYGAFLSKTFGNANRRSAHYQRQAPLAGSVREVRGRIIRLLTAEGAMTAADLERRTAPGEDRFALALDGLVKDGMVISDGPVVRLP